MHLVAQHQRAGGRAGDLPAGFVQLRHRRAVIALLRLQALQVFGELAHQVAARNPDRQGHALQRSRPGNRQRDLKQMGVQVAHLDAVMVRRRGSGRLAGAFGR